MILRAFVLLPVLLASAQETPPAAAVERLKRAREAVAKEASDLREREARLAAILKEKTEREPLRLDLGGGIVFDKVKVTAFEGGRLKLAWPQGATEYSFETLPRAARASLLEAILEKGTARDQFEVGRLFVRTGEYDLGEKCVAKAVALDPALKPLAPDVERLRRMARIFEGPFTLFGSQLSIAWTFKRPEEAKDFAPIEGAGLAIAPGSGLTVSGGKSSWVAVRDVPFQDRLKVSALPVETAGSAHLLGVTFTRMDGREVLIYAAAFTKLKALVVYRREQGQTAKLIEPVAYRPGSRIEMEFARGKFTFRNADKTLWSGNEGGFAEVTLSLGAVGLKENGDAAETSSAVFRDAQLTGNVGAEWLRRRTLDFRAAVQDELDRERRLVRKEGPAKEAAVALSVDARATQALPSAAPAYASAADLVRRFLKSGDDGAHRAAAAAIVRLTEQHAPFAPGWFWRAKLEEEASDAREAERHYGEAVARLPEFPEALCGKARLMMLRGDDAGAGPLVRRALDLLPDLAEAHLLQSRLEAGAGRAAQALEETALARHLAPDDEDIQARVKMMVNVVRGPAWPQSARQETASYAVRGDIPSPRCRAYADHLEAMRAHYEEVLGVPPAPKGKRADVLLFASPEGYYSYMDITSGRRLEHTLGVFNPWYGQMVIFEDSDREETLRVIAHEGFHQYLHGVAQGVPQWFNEGMAEYVGAAKVDRGRVVERGRLQENRLVDLLHAVKYGWTPVPFATIMVEPKSSFYGKDAAYKYAQAWLMIHYFIHGEKGKHRELLGAYVKRLLAGDTGTQAYAATFGAGDVAALQAGWLAYLNTWALVEPGKAPVDVLKLLDFRQDIVRGPWRPAGSKLLSPPEASRAGLAAIRLPYIAPAEYDLTMVVERKENKKGENGSLDIGLLGPGGLFGVVVDSREGRSFLNGMGSADPAGIWQGWVFPDGKPRTLTCAVRKDSFTLSVDGKPIIQWKGDLSQVRADYGMQDKSCLFLCSWIQYAVGKIEVQPVTGSGRPLR